MTHRNEHGEPVADTLAAKTTSPIERLRALCERDQVRYPAGATSEALSALLAAAPRHAAGKALADRLQPLPGTPHAWIGSGDNDIEYPQA